MKCAGDTGIRLPEAGVVGVTPRPVESGVEGLRGGGVLTLLLVMLPPLRTVTTASASGGARSAGVFPP